MIGMTPPDWSDMLEDLKAFDNKETAAERYRNQARRYEKLLAEVWQTVKSSESILRTLRLPIRNENEKKDKIAVLKLYSAIVSKLKIPDNNNDIDILTKRLYDKLISS